MAARSRRGLWRSVAVGGSVVGCVVVLAGSSIGSAAAGTRVRVLQMNLCNSGIASCYTGRAVAEAAAVIRTTSPDLVTLNEVCRNDVTTLERVLSEAETRGDAVESAFQPAADCRTAAAFRCRNGQPYGIGLLARIPSHGHGYAIHAGIYPIQDTSDPEERAWLCLDTSDIVACTTHLASTKPTVALAQCRYLLDTAVPTARRQGRDEPTVLGGDLNLRPHHVLDVRSCLPAGYVQTNDDGTQYVIASPDLAVSSRTTIGMNRTTDHPGLLGTLAGS
jgi:endonuclease/exonuclease/phosphatase family metal-dependent hydrolase